MVNRLNRRIIRAFRSVVAELSGLAMLGGGAVALGEWGVVRGTAIVIGGGAVLGLGGGSIYSIYMISDGSAMVAQDIVKLETLGF